VLLYAPGLLLSAIVLFFAYLMNRKLTSAQIYWALSAPGLILTIVYSLNFRPDLSLDGNMGVIVIGALFFPALWILLLAMAFASGLIYLQRRGRQPIYGVSVATLIISALLIALYFATAFMAEQIF
jgi:hypothetical protein